MFSQWGLFPERFFSQSQSFRPFRRRPRYENCPYNHESEEFIRFIAATHWVSNVNTVQFVLTPFVHLEVRTDWIREDPHTDLCVHCPSSSPGCCCSRLWGPSNHRWVCIFGVLWVAQEFWGTGFSQVAEPATWNPSWTLRSGHETGSQKLSCKVIPCVQQIIDVKYVWLCASKNKPSLQLSSRASCQKVPIKGIPHNIPKKNVLFLGLPHYLEHPLVYLHSSLLIWHFFLFLSLPRSLTA